MKAPSYLFRRKSSNFFYFRYVLPADLHKFAPVREIRRSLETYRRHEALQKARMLTSSVEHLVARLRQAKEQGITLSMHTLGLIIKNLQVQQRQEVKK